MKTKKPARIYTRVNGRLQSLDEDGVLEAASNILLSRLHDGPVLDNPDTVRQFLQCKIGTGDAEVFAALFLDTRNRLLGYRSLFQGTLNGTAVYPREVVRAALGYNAGAVICTHNHPSGVAEPSRSDEILTTKLKEALALVDIRLLDHLIVCGGEVLSFSERGLI